MTLEKIRGCLGWCAIINVGLLCFWMMWLMFAHDFVYRTHGAWFNISVEQFDAVHYKGMLYFKMGIFLFNVVPYLALKIVGKNRDT